MAKIDFAQTFGNTKTTPAAKQDRPKAEYWLNVGYDSGVLDDNGESRFVSLAQGIPLDTIERLSTNGRNKEFAAFQAARNDLLDQVMSVAQQLEPGQSVVIDTETSLQIQIRRVSEDAAEIPVSENQFARQLKLA